MQPGHVFTLANRSMKKPLLAAASVALSVGGLLGSAPAVAQTYASQSTADAVWDRNVQWSNGVQRYFYFQDSRLNRSDPYGGSPHFAELKQDICSWWCSSSPYFVDGSGGIADLRISYDARNPYIASYINSRDSDFYRRESFSYDSETFFRDGTFNYEYEDSFIRTGFGVYSSVEPDGTETRTLRYYYYSGEYSESYIYTVNTEDSYIKTYQHVLDGVKDFNPFDVEEKIKSKMKLDLLPTSGVGIFDFENSFVYYAGENEGVSLAEMFADGGMGWGVSFAYSEGNIYHDSLYYFGDFKLSWYTGTRVITGMTLAYNLAAIPEPETWAMLLAGLGIVGAVTRRQRIKAAM